MPDHWLLCFHKHLKHKAEANGISKIRSVGLKNFLFSRATGSEDFDESSGRSANTEDTRVVILQVDVEASAEVAVAVAELEEGGAFANAAGEPIFQPLNLSMEEVEVGGTVGQHLPSCRSITLAPSISAFKLRERLGCLFSQSRSLCLAYEINPLSKNSILLI